MPPPNFIWPTQLIQRKDRKRQDDSHLKDHQDTGIWTLTPVGNITRTLLGTLTITMIMITHDACITILAALRASLMLSRRKDIGMQLDLQTAKEKTRKNLKPTIKQIKVCGKQKISLRGHSHSGRVGGK